MPSEQKWYVVLRLGATRCKTVFSKKTAKPRWNETRDLLLYDLKQTLFVEVWCRDGLVSSDKMIAKSQEMEVRNLLRGDQGPKWIMLDALKKYHALDRRTSLQNLFKDKQPSRKTSACKVQLSFQLFSLNAYPGQVPTASPTLTGNVALLVCNVLKGRIPDA